jgi:hypothetical protein
VDAIARNVTTPFNALYGKKAFIALWVSTSNASASRVSGRSFEEIAQASIVFFGRNGSATICC